jgi:hypothetical protein
VLWVVGQLDHGSLGFLCFLRRVLQQVLLAQIGAAFDRRRRHRSDGHTVRDDHCVSVRLGGGVRGQQSAPVTRAAVERRRGRPRRRAHSDMDVRRRVMLLGSGSLLQQLVLVWRAAFALHRGGSQPAGGRRQLKTAALSSCPPSQQA